MPLAFTGGDGIWLPISVDRLEIFARRAIQSGRGYGRAYALCKNIAYNLQYVEYLNRTLADIKLTSVLQKQTWKTQIVVGCGIIESLLHFLVVATGNQTTTPWETRQEFTGAHRNLEGRRYRIDSTVKEMVDPPKPVPMTFDALLKKSESRRLLGNDQMVYARLKRLRPLRNRVHLQQIADHLDHDFNAFEPKDHKLLMQVLHSVLTGSVFAPSEEQYAYFSYMEKYLDSDE